MGGVNPVNLRSEFAGIPFVAQKSKIRAGVSIMREHGIDPKIFFAPAHTFDKFTVQALLEESNIRYISDTPANKPYQKWGMTFVPQQAGSVRMLPFNTVTFCYHPNTMTGNDFQDLEKFFKNHQFKEFPLQKANNHESIYDKFLMLIYYMMHRM